jgi:hypothetical protein
MLNLAALRRAVPLIEARLVELEAKITSGDESAWSAYLETLTAATMLQAQASPGAGGELITTSELAATLGVAPKTILRRRAKGELKAVVTGRRGRAALRWNAAEGTR